jgi:hypothetical protein
MRPLVNLANEPFRNRRLFWLIIILIFSVFSVVGLNTLQDISGVDYQIAALRPEVEKREKQVKELEKPGLVAPSALRPEQNQALQAASLLIAHKSFSWSQLLNDLERHIPPAVRVLRITVDKVERSQRDAASEAKSKTVLLTLDVVGKSSEAVTQMIYDFNKSGLFAVVPKTSKQVEGIEEWEFALDVEYRPAIAESAPRALARQ